MYQVLGWPALVGVASLFLATPITLVLAKLISDLMAAQMKVKDERLRVLSEIISGMRLVKLCAWELPFTERILERREEETQVLRKKGALGSGFSFLWNMIPFMVGFVAFACHAGISSSKLLISTNTKVIQSHSATGEQLTAEQAFTTLAYLNIMRCPMTFHSFFSLPHLDEVPMTVLFFLFFTPF